MSKYTLSLKKNDILMQLISDDKHFVNSELEKWVGSVTKVKKTIDPVNLLQETYEEAKSSLDNTASSKHVKASKTNKFINESEETKQETFAKKEDFSEVLNEKINTSPVIEDENSFSNNENNSLKTFESIVADKSIKSHLDYLVAASYYFCEIEGLERYSLKQINSKVIKFTEKPIDHSIVQKAINKELIKVVPDYTGMAEVTEYALTQDGKEYFENEI